MAQSLSQHRLVCCNSDDSVLIAILSGASVQGAQPFVWVMEGPTSVSHNFLSQPICEVAMVLTIRNCSIYTGSIKVETQDLVNPPTLPPQETLQFGWTPLSSTSTPPATPTPSSASIGETLTTASSADPAASLDHLVHRTPTTPPFLWCNLRSTCMNSLAPGASAQVSLRVAFLAPGIYDLSRYRISWTLQLDELVPHGQSPRISQLSESKSELHLKTTSATYSVGYSASLPVNSSSLPSDASSVAAAAAAPASGVGFGHPLLLSVVQSNT